MTTPLTSFSGEPCPRRFNMARYVIGASAAEDPDKQALAVYRDATADARPDTWSFAEVESTVLGIAAGLAELGLDRGARLLVGLDKSPDYPFTVFAALAVGLTPVPLSSELTAEEIAFIAGDCAAGAIAVADGADRAGLPPGLALVAAADMRRWATSGATCAYADTTSDEPAYIVYTSGTTARPKGVVHGHRAAWGRRPMYEGWHHMGPEARVLHAGAFNWTFTLGTGITDPWANGATALIYTGPKSPIVWPQLIRVSAATIFAAVPGVFRQILKHAPDGPIDLGQLRHGLMAGEAPPAGLIADWQARTATGLYEALGMSEISTYVSSSPETGVRAGWVGKPQPGRAVAIVPLEGGTDPLPHGEVGLIAVHRSDPGLMLGYWNRPEEEADVLRGDWFVGGDVGAMDADGWIAHHGRADDILKPLGYRVSPQEIEAVLETHPAVAEAACTEIEIEDGVRLICAYIVALDPCVPPDTAELERHAAEHLATYKRPRLYRFVGSLPRTANGKLQRSRLATIPDQPT